MTATPERTVPTSAATVWTIVAVTWTRLLRGRALWVAGGIGVLPVLFGVVLRSEDAGGVAGILMTIEGLMLAVLPAMLVASSIGEEIEDRTMTYLWSRPVPRWAVLIGKLIALTPIVIAIVVASWYAGMRIGVAEGVPLAGSCAALAAGALVTSVIAMAVAVLAPKHAMALSISYMLFVDLPIGGIPASIENLSITHHVRALADLRLSSIPPEPWSVGGPALLVIAALWLVIALWRVRRLEA